MHTAIIKTLEERQRQIHEEGFTAEHDDQNKPGRISWAAGCYAMRAGEQAAGFAMTKAAPFVWPWHENWWKPSEDPKRNIIKAMALLAAEYDRLERAEAAATPAPPPETVFSTDDEWQSGIYDDLGELIEDRELVVGDTVYIGVKRLAQPREFINDLDDVVIDAMADRAENEYGDYAETYPELEEPQQQTLQILIEAWADTHCRPDFYTIAHVRAHTLTRDDIAAAMQEPN
ncbi:hypothetical protein K1Y77_17145 (plasmid) [Halomonas qaidamensis]|uniref:Uncharacterized protein n=1 Tax=Halomonas qaidamensis TaxID=2866211 RepID=A0ABY6JUL1_9GAMM|nr:hypothetical protein [Halomonas qaidamensis]UYV20946.1 hypothetical protein K1Y77_17145 [Halomonas qaidamensis]